MTRLIVALIVLVAAPRLAAAQILSPGPLAAAHASIDDDNSCNKCHDAGKQVGAKLCLDCHKDLASQISGGRGLHGLQYKGKACEDCHHEHISRGTKLIRWPGGAMESLDHGQTGYKLEGGHAAVACLKCHTKTSPLGKPQFVGTKTACGACHKDPHAGKFGTSCQKCHAVTAKFQTFDRQAFDHKLARYELTGKHASVACDKCHAGSPPKWKPLEFSTCETCHADPHKGQFKPKPCTECHDTGSWTSATDKMRQNHPWLSLAAGHATVKCEKCHDKGNNKPPSKGKRCEGCHRPIHLAKFGTRCETCHASIKWVGLPAAVGRDNHVKTRYPLEGMHVKTACAGCHPAAKPVASRFKNLSFAACASCHPDKHKTEFAARSNGECAPCHTVAGFAPTRFGLAEHATTKFALDGKHVATPCGGCHTTKRPRLDWRVTKQACADCHDNPHGTQFATEMANKGCATCHSTRDWHQPSIDHSIWPLDGAHARTACAGCHGEQQQGAKPAAYRGIPRDCEGCHDDLHAGQFRQTQPTKACKDCHATQTFKIGKTFPHDRTRYPLRGRHVAVACGECHKTETLRNGTTAVRYRLGYTQCKDCHANPHREGP